MTTTEITALAFHASVDHSEDVACCEGFIAAGELVAMSPDGSIWHPACAEVAGFEVKPA